MMLWKLIKKNIQNLNLSENDTKKIKISQYDATKLKKLNLPNFDFVYIDPPYKNNRSIIKSYLI